MQKVILISVLGTEESVWKAAIEGGIERVEIWVGGFNGGLMLEV